GISVFAQTAVAPFVHENAMHNVSRSHGRAGSTSARPPQMSTIASPSRYTVHAAPMSPCSAKFAANASATRSKPGVTTPRTSTGAGYPASSGAGRSTEPGQRRLGFGDDPLDQ